jgi:hypothetical protein
MGAAGGDDHRVGQRGLGGDVDGDDVFGLGVVEAGDDEGGERGGVQVVRDDRRGRSERGSLLGTERDGQMSDLLSRTASPNAGGTRHSLRCPAASMSPTGPQGPTRENIRWMGLSVQVACRRDRPIGRRKTATVAHRTREGHPFGPEID